LIREGLGCVLGPAPRDPEDHDLWHSLAGFAAGDISAGPGEVDDIVYER
jgi:hypothetical protein